MIAFDRGLHVALGRIRPEAAIQRLRILGRFNPPFFMAVQNAVSAAAPTLFVYCSAWYTAPVTGASRTKDKTPLNNHPQPLDR
jgi:hypothetical protein